MIVVPVRARAVGVGRAVAVVEFAAEQDVNNKAVGGAGAREPARGHARVSGEFADDGEVLVAREHLRVTGDENAHVEIPGKRARQRRGHFAQSADLHVIGHLGGDEKDAAFEGRGES